MEKRYRLKVNYCATNNIRWKKGDTFIKDASDFYRCEASLDDLAISKFESYFVENNPDIFEQISPIEIEGWVMETYTGEYKFTKDRNALSKITVNFNKAKLIIEG